MCVAVVRRASQQQARSKELPLALSARQERPVFRMPEAVVPGINIDEGDKRWFLYVFLYLC